MLTSMIFAKDHHAMVAFYRDGFELAILEDASGPGYTVLADDTIRLAIHAVPTAVAEEISIADPPEARSASAMKLVFDVADFGPTCDRLAQLGARFLASVDAEARDALDVEGNVFRVSAAS